MTPTAKWSLLDRLGDLLPPIHVVDLGALWTGDKGEPYYPLLRSDRVRVIGFEPIPEECRLLNQKYGPSNVYLPYAVADGRLRRFHRCNYAMTSSLYEPDLECMGLFQNLPHFCQVQESWEIQTVRLDDVQEAHGADYLKIDVQGAELDVLIGAEKVLRTALAIQTEVEFVPIYRGQPLFADIDRFLRGSGFLFHRFVNSEGRVLRSLDVSHDLPATRSQMLWSDAVYIRAIFEWDRLPDESLLKLAVILHELYGSFDFAASLLHLHDGRSGGDLCRSYLEALGMQPGPATAGQAPEREI